MKNIHSSTIKNIDIEQAIASASRVGQARAMTKTSFGQFDLIHPKSQMKVVHHPVPFPTTPLTPDQKFQTHPFSDTAPLRPAHGHLEVQALACEREGLQQSHALESSQLSAGAAIIGLDGLGALSGHESIGCK